MAASALTEEEAMQNLPEKLSKGAARGAWARREEVWKLHLEGKNPEQIKDRVHQPLRAVEWLISKLPEAGPPESREQGGDQGEGGTAEPTEPAGGPAEGAPADGGARAPARVEGPAARPPSAIDRAQMAAQLESMDLGSVGSPAGKSPFAGTVEMPDMYARLADVCRLMGMTPEKAKGVAVSFAYTGKDAKDFTRLYEILVGLGQPGPVAKTIVATWQGMNASPSESGGTFTVEPGGTAKLEDVERRLGLHPKSSAEETDIEKLDKEERQLRIEKAKNEIREQRERLGIGARAAGGDEDDGTIEILLNIGGMPVPKRIKESQLPMYQSFIAKPGGQSTEELPAYAKAILEQNKALQERLDRQDRDHEEERRQRESDERLAKLLDTRLGPIEQRLQTNPQETDTAKELRAMREDREKERNDGIKTELVRLRQDVQNATTPEGLRAAQDRYMAGARQFGLVPRSEVGVLTEEQIALDGERKAVTRRDQMTGDLMEVAKTKLNEQGPLRKIGQSVADAGVGREIIDFAKKKLNSQGGGPAEELVAPTDAEYAETARQLELAAEAAGERRPRAEPRAEPPSEGVA